MKLIPVIAVFALFLAANCMGQERPYFVTYSHEMEEPDNLEIEFFNAIGKPQQGNRFIGSTVEFEYGATGWWTSELYLDGQMTLHDSTVFTGYRWENRFRPLLREHWINPVLYVEFANVNSADKTLLEVVGHDGREDFLERNSRAEKKREAELKLILSSNFKGWNVSENIIAEKNLTNEPWEFGYAFAVSRPLSLAATPNACTFCRENFSAGAEMYGGLGDRYSFGLKNTSHHFAPIVGFRM